MLSRYVGDRAFYRRVFQVAIPIIIQNGITNFVSLLDNIMVGQVGAPAHERCFHRQSDHFCV